MDKIITMKKLLLLFVLVTLVGCKKEIKSNALENTTVIDENERTEKQSDGLTHLKGQFIYYADAAVLQTHREVYGVVINNKMHEVNDLAKQFKKAATDMVSVEVRGKITPKPENEEGWPFRVEIVEILNVSAPDPTAGEMITIGKE